jgi:hypothetical protein
MISTFPAALDEIVAAAVKGSLAEAVAAEANETKSLLRTLGILSVL